MNLPSGPRQGMSLRIARWIVGIASRMAPHSIRVDWRSEWEAELAHRWITLDNAEGGFLDYALLVRQSLGAPVHAAWLFLQEWRFEMVNQDIKFAVRVLFKNPVFSLVVVVTIALGIGANTAIFSVVNGVLLEPLSYESPDELVMVWERSLRRDNPANPVSGANFASWRDGNTVFTDIAAVSAFSSTVLGAADPERTGTVGVTAGFFPILGVTPQVGRVFLPEEDVDGGPAVIMISDGLWQRRFGGDPGAVGRTLNVSGREREIVGVLPRGFQFELPYTFNFTGEQDIWELLQLPEEILNSRGRWIQVVGRLKPGVSLARAQEEMTTIAQRAEIDFPDHQSGWGINVVPLHQQVVGDVSRALWIMLGAVASVLLIAVANVANLLLARSTGRSQEISVRMALGASRTRVIRQLLTESLILAGVGGMVGVLMSHWAVTGLLALGPDLPRLDLVGVDLRVLIWAVTISLLSGLAFGLAPALRVSRPDLNSALREGGSRAGAGRGLVRLRNGLAVAEIAISLVLLVGAGLLLRSFNNLVGLGVGFEPRNLLTFQVQPPGSEYDAIQRADLFDRLVGEIAAIPGITNASAVTFPPLAGSGSATNFWAADRPIPAPGEFPVADLKWALPEYLSTMGIPLLQGRFLEHSDTDASPLVVVVNRWAAEEFWPDEDPIGKVIHMPWGDTLVAEVVGVVENVRHKGPDQEVRTVFYWSNRQFPNFNFMTVVARTTGDPLEYVSQVRRRVAGLDAALPIYNARSMESYFGESVAKTRFAMLVLGLFAVVALVLAAIGVYGVMSYTVGERTREMGIRTALGAAEGDLLRLVLQSGLRIVVTALVIGVAGSLAVARVMEGLVFGVGTRDPVTMVGVSLLLGAVALVACYVPALRASRVAPTESLKYD